MKHGKQREKQDNQDAVDEESYNDKQYPVPWEQVYSNKHHHEQHQCREEAEGDEAWVTERLSGRL